MKEYEQVHSNRVSFGGDHCDIKPIEFVKKENPKKQRKIGTKRAGQKKKEKKQAPPECGKRKILCTKIAKVYKFFHVQHPPTRRTRFNVCAHQNC